MAVRIARTSERQADRLLAGLAVLAAGCGVIVGIGEERLTLGGGGSTVTPLVIRVSGAERLDSGAGRVALDVMRSRLRATDGVRGIERGAASPNGRSTSIRVRLSDDPKQSARAVETIVTQLDPGPLRVAYSGGASELQEARDQSFDDLRLLLLAVPLAALILVAALGAQAALATSFATAAAVLGAGALCVGLSLLIDISVLCLVGAAAGGIPCGVLLCALARRGAAPRALIAAALASAATFGSLAALGIGYLAAIGLGGALASLLAAPIAIVAIHAATDLWQLGPRGDPGVERLLGGLASRLSWSRLVAAAVAILSAAALVVIAVPATRLEPGALAAARPPSISTERGLIVAGALIVCLTAIGWTVCRRPFASLAGALTAALAPAAAVGLAVIVFQDGRLERLLDFEPFTIGVGSLAAGAIAVAAASAAQGVAALARLSGSEAHARAAAWPPSGYGSLVAAAAAASISVALAAACLLASSLEFAKTFALIVAAGALLDLILVRCLIGTSLNVLVNRRAERRTGAE